MRIWLITVGEPLPSFSGGDRLWRTGYLARLLASRGHEVTWWTSSFDHFRRSHFIAESARVEVEPNLTIQFLHGRSYRSNISIERQINHWQIGRELRRLARTYPRPGIILCSFPTIELSREAARYGRQHGVPTFLDIRDLWPDEMVDRLPPAIQSLGRAVLTPLYVQTRRALAEATGLIAISDRFLDWGVGFAGRQRAGLDRVFPMGYTGTLDVSTVRETTRETLRALGLDSTKKIFWFAGTFVGNIDLGTVIEAARSLRGNPEIQFVLSGSGERDALWRAQATGLENVLFTGWARSEDLAYLASVAWAGLGAYRSGAKMSLPNKLFEYMSAGLPVLLSLEGETRDLVVNNEIGIAYAGGDPASLRAAVLRIADDATLRENMSKNAIRLFRDRYSPEAIYNEYADFLTHAAST